MKFASIYLLNYIGIYNGLGLYEMHIDLTRCKNRITIIRGDNGSGKSTLMKALSVFPDPNDSFIPGMPARKEIVLVDGQTLYKLVFVHDVKNNGDRETTKAYITKTFNDTVVELNQNGNVSSYKDILYSELGLDANFAALSQLSNDDRGLADKKPAERKKFVNSIISSLEVYNNIYKSLTKMSSNYKSMINAVVAKLNVLGDEQSLNSNLEVLENKINTLQDTKDKAISLLAQDQSRISLLDPNGSIQSINHTLLSEISEKEKELLKQESTINALVSANNITTKDYDAGYKHVVDTKNSLIIQNQIDRNDIQNLMRQKEIEAEELNKKIQKISSLNNDDNYEMIAEKIQEYTSKLLEIEQLLRSAGIEDINSISKEEYIFALETLKDLDNYIASFKSSADYSIIEELVKYYLETGNVHPLKDVESYRIDKENLGSEIRDFETEYNNITSRLDLLNILKMKPEECKNTSCSFISEAIKFAESNPIDRLELLKIWIDDYTKDYNVLTNIIRDNEAFNDSVNKFAIIVREVNRNASILSKMPNGEMFKDTRLFFDRLISGYSFEYMSSIYEYIDLANQFDIYKQTSTILEEYKKSYNNYQSRAYIIDNLNEDIDKINKTLTNIMDKITPVSNAVLEREKRIAQLQELEGVYEAIILQSKNIDSINKSLNDLKNKLEENNKKMVDIELSLNRIETHKNTINNCNMNLAPLMQDRDKLIHSIQMMKDYKTEKEELENNYNFIETLKYYSSPTTGIQLVFMELYMGKIISLANELLSLLFKGQYVIQPFVINESEFRIPCLGSGYLNDDISSMSSSQIGMISMILSFALLHHSSTKYNIIKLDEIDGPLDYNNRTYFTDVLNSIMNIMGTEQCIMISHNSELQIDDFDIILLKHDSNNTDYLRGNIIWSY